MTAATPPRREDDSAPPPTVLGIDADSDPLTRRAAKYRNDNVYPYLTTKGFALDRPPAQPAAAAAASKANVVYLTGVGHGLPDSYLGDKDVPIFQAGLFTMAQAGGKIVHFLSCLTAVTLGPSFVSSGCQAYFSYDSLFSFTPDDADTFFECDSEIDLAFADGLSAQDVYDRVKALFEQRIKDLQSAGKWQAAAALENDWAALRSPASGPEWGDPTATVA
jgi:hypothetical protein